jgi:hypothetical protein
MNETKKPKKEKKANQKIVELNKTIATLTAELEEWRCVADLNTDKLNLLHDALFKHTQSLLIQKILLSSELLADSIKLELLDRVVGLTPTYQESDNVE